MSSRSLLISIVASLLLTLVLLPIFGFGGLLAVGLLVLAGWVGLRALKRHSETPGASLFGAGLRTEKDSDPEPTMPPDDPLTHDERVQFNEVIRNWNSEPPKRV